MMLRRHGGITRGPKECRPPIKDRMVTHSALSLYAVNSSEVTRKNRNGRVRGTRCFFTSRSHTTLFFSAVAVVVTNFKIDGCVRASIVPASVRCQCTRMRICLNPTKRDSIETHFEARSAERRGACTRQPSYACPPVEEAGSTPRMPRVNASTDYSVAPST